MSILTAPTDGPVTPATRDEPRLVWAPSHPGLWIHGAWWPRSRDIVTELAAFLPAADTYLAAPLTHLSLNPSDWEHQPRRLHVGRRVIRLAWFSSLAPGTIGIGAEPLTRFTVVLIAPATPAAAGEQILQALQGCDVWPAEPGQLLALGAYHPRVPA